MTAHEALWLIKTQLQKNEQNIQAVKVLEDMVKIANSIHIDDDEPTYTLDEAAYQLFGTQAAHIKNHMEKVAKQDIHELHEKEKYHAEWVHQDGKYTYREKLDADNLCARYEWAEDDELVVFYEMCDTD